MSHFLDVNLKKSLTTIVGLYHAQESHKYERARKFATEKTEFTSEAYTIFLARMHKQARFCIF